MKIVDVHVDGFGVWSDLSLADLSPHCTVFYGPNEAGKTTVLEFLRAIFYGFSPGRAARYLPPVHGSPGGGSLTVIADDEGLLRVCRCESVHQSLGNVAVEDADGTVQGEAHLRRLLHDVDESMFQNVFAVGIQELQELGTLNDSEAARWLYLLASARDRVSLGDVLTELQNLKRRTWSESSTSEVGQLLLLCDQLRGEVAEQGKASEHLELLVADRARAEKDIATIDQALIEEELICRKWETAAGIYDSWQRRQTLTSQLQALGSAAQWPPDADGEMQRLQVAARKVRRGKRQLAARRKLLAKRRKSISLNAALLRHATKIEVLGENESWIASLEQDIREKKEAVDRLATDRQAQQGRLNSILPGLTGANASGNSFPMSQLNRDVWRSLRRPAQALMEAERIAKEERQVDQQRPTQSGNRQNLQQALAARGQKNLTAALDAAGQRVTQLRRRIQLDALVEQLASNKADLEHAIAGYMQRQILPPWMLLAVGGIFVLGVVLILGGLLLPGSFTGSLGWPMACLGLLGVGSAVAAKFSIERSAANQLDASRRQLTLVELQTTQANAEIADLNRTLPRSAGSLAGQLQSAEQELAKLEELLPLDAERQSVEQATQDAVSRRQQADQSHQQALDDWLTALVACGLPESLVPAQMKLIFGVAQQISRLEQQRTEAQAELDRRGRELAAFSSRVEQVVAATDGIAQEMPVSQQLKQLRQTLTEEETKQKRRRLLLRRLRKCKRRQREVSRTMRRLRNRRRQLLLACGVPNLAEFRRRSAEFSQIASTIAQRDAVASEIASAVSAYAFKAGPSAESDLSSLMSIATLDEIMGQLTRCRQQLEQLHRDQRRLFEDQGRLNEQIRALCDDRNLTKKRFELAQVEQRVAVAVRRWSVLAVTYRWLEAIKEYYEHHRQPEALSEASQFLQQMTSGRYRRVWTRWGENVLFVDDYDGHTLPVEVLSRGTREQLFLCLRLSLVSLFARRGVNLPVVLDDVLVNFDTERATAAIEVLNEFSHRGHQLLVFTCHEHLARIFKSHRMDVRLLPTERQSGRDRPFEVEAQVSPRRNKVRRVKEEQLAQPPIEPPLLVELPPLEEPLPISHPAPVRLDSPEQVVRASPLMRRWAYWQDEDEQLQHATSSTPREGTGDANREGTQNGSRDTHLSGVVE